MNNASEYAAYYLDLMRQGYAEAAFFGLIEAEQTVIPVLMEALVREENFGTHAQIVQCIWQHRRSEDISFLVGLLDDPDSTVWQEALDGLVAIGGSEAISGLYQVRMRLPAERSGKAISVDWIDEALEQIQEAK
jgi:HEAT repeats